jgi:hypothetical protein
MKDMTKQVIILNNFTSPYIHQAIIVLKDYNPALEDQVLRDAEKIVSKYLENVKKNEQFPVRSHKSKLKRLAVTSALVVLIIAAFAFFQLFPLH